MGKRFSYCGAVFIAVAVGALAITSQSLWIDEGTAALIVMRPTLHDLWQMLSTDRSSNLQMPLHFFYLWIWEKVFGASEIALRAANIPPLALAFIAIVWGLKERPRWQFWFIALASINAFTWYYVNEARPYILLFAGCCITFACLARAYFSPASSLESRSWFFNLLAGSLMVCATNMIAAPWAMASILGAALLLGRKPFVQLMQRRLFWSCVWLFAICCLAAYYLWTISLGAIPTNIGRTGISNLFAIAYEQLGLAGLGPGRIELRQASLNPFWRYALVLIVPFLAVLAVAWQSGTFLLCRWKTAKLYLWVTILIVLPAACVLLAAWIGHARLWGRHFTPMFPFVLFGLAVGVEQLRQKKTLGARVALCAFLIALALSCLEIRFAPRHAKDDYRSAATHALSDVWQKRLVWWAADENTGIYYRLPIRDEAGTAYWQFLKEPLASDLASRPEPHMIVRSKPDVYDRLGTLSQYISSHGYRLTHVFQAFEIWEL